MNCKSVEDCKKELTKSKLTLKDKKGGKSKLLINNKSESKFAIIDFEECVYKNKENDTKCDFGLIANQSIFFIELKGSDVSTGFKQLLQTINETEKCFIGLKKKSRLIVSKYSKPDLAKKSKAYKDLIKKLGNTERLIVKQNLYQEII